MTCKRRKTIVRQRVKGLLQNTDSVAKGKISAYFLAAVRNSLRHSVPVSPPLVQACFVSSASAFPRSKLSPARFVRSPVVLVDPLPWVYCEYPHLTRSECADNENRCVSGRPAAA